MGPVALVATRSAPPPLSRGSIPEAVRAAGLTLTCRGVRFGDVRAEAMEFGGQDRDFSAPPLLDTPPRARHYTQ